MSLSFFKETRIALNVVLIPDMVNLIIEYIKEEYIKEDFQKWLQNIKSVNQEYSRTWEFEEDTHYLISIIGRCKVNDRVLSDSGYQGIFSFISTGFNKVAILSPNYFYSLRILQE